MSCRRAVLAALFVGPLFAAPVSLAQDRAWPNQPIRVIVPFSAGTSDTVARLVTGEMAKSIGQPFVVENRPGAGGNIGAEACAKARPDGHTICLGTISSHAINPGIYPKLPYDNLKDFAPITQLAAQPNAIAVGLDFAPKTVPELIAYVKARKDGDVAFATSGVGTSIHLAGALFGQMVGTKLEHIPYRGSGQVVTALLSGEVPMAFDNFSSVWPLAREGKLRVLAVTGSERATAAPDVPTVAETLPGFLSLSWHGLFAPAGTPPEVVARLQREAVAALASEPVSSRFRDLGITPVGSTPEAFAAFVASETARWGQVAKQADIRVE